MPKLIAELLKKGGESLWRRIHYLIKMIWKEHKMPEEWSMGIIQPIYKKGDKLECSNCRAITLLNITYKILSGIFHDRLTEYTQEILGQYQCGYRVSCSTIEHIFTIRKTQEKKKHMSTIYIYIICT